MKIAILVFQNVLYARSKDLLEVIYSILKNVESKTAVTSSTKSALRIESAVHTHVPHANKTSK